MSIERRSSVMSFATNRFFKANGEKTFIKVLHGENKTLILNSYCSCLHLLNYIKEKLNLSIEDSLDFIDLEGYVKEIPANSKDYAIQYLNPTNIYIVLRIDTDPNTGEKRYTPLVTESKINPSISKSLVNLNTGKAVAKEKKKEVKKQITQQSTTQSTTKTSNTHASRRNSKIVK